jgi:hypothetical protein
MTGARYEVNGEDIAAEVAGGEAIILNLSSGVYYSLAGAGALAWLLLERSHTAAEAGALIASRSGVDAGTATADVEALLDRLLAEGLLAPSREARPGEVVDSELPALAEYAPPALERYSDMEHLLALDPPMPGLSEVPWQAPPR